MNYLKSHIEKLNSVRESNHFDQVCAVYHAESVISSISKEMLSSDDLHTISEIHEIVRCIDSQKVNMNTNKYLIDALILRINKIKEKQLDSL